MAGSYRPEVGEEYAAERPDYEALAEGLAGRLEADLKTRGIYADVTWRAKEVLSFVKKALRKGYDNPLNDIGDKAGVRVVVPYLADVETVEEACGGLVEVSAREQKLDALAYNELGYLGVHLQTVAKPTVLKELALEALEGRALEIQIHTRAQSAWAVVSHELLYKSPLDVPDDLRRSITRLVALVELFDGEIARFRQAMEFHPDYPFMQILPALDDELIRFTPRKPDRGLSALVLPALMPLYGDELEGVLENVLKPFMNEASDRLEAIFEHYDGDDRANPLLFQPEVFVILERLESDRDHLREAWPVDQLPIELLESMADIWGVEL